MTSGVAVTSQVPDAIANVADVSEVVGVVTKGPPSIEGDTEKVTT
jgi:hypothetical protein